jgi:membrane associated rhomboid family serine protease
VLLIAANVIVFLISKGGARSFVAKWGEVPGEIQYLGKTYQLFTAPWIHLSVLHIALNMLSLLVVGRPVELAIGKIRFLLLYLGSAMGGSVAYFLIAPPRTPGAGASGAIFGVVGALFVVSRNRGMETGGILGLIIINLVYGFIDPNIGWQAHLGGLAAGVGIAAGFLLAERWRGGYAVLVDVATCAVASVVMLGLMQFPCRHIPGIP